MAKVYLYEDSSGSLYLHGHDTNVVYANVDVMVPYGATFEQDAGEIADGREASGDGVLKLPYTQFEAQMPERGIRRIAVWEDGRILRLGTPGRDGALYLESPRDINPQEDREGRA